MMATIREQLKKLEADANLVDTLRTMGKTDGGKLTEFGKDFVHACVKNKVQNSVVAKILDVTPSAISQWASKLNV